ncbi:MAG: glycosyltransferase family 4 protein [Bryobacteraceae bacterium]
MRVLHIDAGKSLRGGQRQTLHLMGGLADHGMLVRLLAIRGSPLFGEAERQGLKALPLNLFSVWRESGWADVVHCHDSRAHTMAWLASIGPGRRVPVVVSRRVAFPVKNSVISGKKYGSAALFLSVSRTVTAQLTAAGVPEERIALVPDGVFVPPYTGNRTGGIVALDSSDPGKGRSLLKGVKPRIEFVRELEKAFRTARIFLYATEMEGLGSAALLAMAHGVPVIASDVGGLPEIVNNGTTGLLAENSPQAFEAAIRRLEDDPHLAEHMIRNARAMVEQSYTVEHMVERTLACYRKVLG